MKEKFYGYYPLSETEMASLWKECTFVFDTNILLGLYRYSSSTQKEILKIMEKLKDRIWISHQTAYEFMKDRVDVIEGQRLYYESIITEITEAKKRVERIITEKRLNMQIDKKKMSAFSLKAKELVSISEDMEKDCIDRTNDPIFSKIEELFADKTGDPLALDIDSFEKEADKRFALQTPPGYMDSTKKNGNKYGDLLFWYELIQYSKSNLKSIILITDDRKEDWWKICHGKTVSPRPELLNEFKTKTSMDVYIYELNQFTTFAQIFLKEAIPPNATAEIKQRSKDVDEEDLKIIIGQIAMEKDILNQKMHQIENSEYSPTMLASKFVKSHNNDNLSDSEYLDYITKHMDSNRSQDYLERLQAETICKNRIYHQRQKEIEALSEHIRTLEELRRQRLAYLRSDNPKG